MILGSATTVLCGSSSSGSGGGGGGGVTTLCLHVCECVSVCVCVCVYDINKLGYMQCECVLCGYLASSFSCSTLTK